MLTSEVRLPIQLNLRASYWTPVASSSGCIASPRANMPMVLPSFGAALNRKLAARRLPAPAMFCGTTVGLPGRCLPRWRASVRI